MRRSGRAAIRSDSPRKHTQENRRTGSAPERREPRRCRPPPAPEEEAIRARLATIGVGPGKTFSFKDLSLEHKAEILLGMKEGAKKVEEAVANIGKDINGWRVGSAFGDRAYYNGNWLPAPDGPIYMVMRLYWPKPDPPSILPPGEGTWSPPALVQVE